MFLLDQDLADILGRTDFDFEIMYFGIVWDPKFPDFQVPDFQISRNLAWARLGPPGRAGRTGPGSTATATATAPPQLAVAVAVAGWGIWPPWD